MSRVVAPTAYLPASRPATPEIPEYPQFVYSAIPVGSNAFRAWTGVVQPFRDDETARRFLRCVEANSSFDIIEGTIEANDAPGSKHWADAWLVRTQLRFRLLVLEFDGKRHPEARVLQPEISRQIHPTHPHLRDDRLLTVGHRRLPALCVYSAAVFEYSCRCSRIVQFLDQTSAYLGRHIIWLKTLVEFPTSWNARPRVPNPGQPIFDLRPAITLDPNLSWAPRQNSRWSGYWPGPVAPSGYEDHLRTIPPSRECWCGKGRRYGDCHRPLELAWRRNARG